MNNVLSQIYFWQKPNININMFLTSGKLKVRKQDLKQKSKIGEYNY